MPTVQHAPDPLPLRLTVVNPPPGVLWAVQVGRDSLAQPSLVTLDTITFELTVGVARSPARGTPRLLGPVVQGPPAARFFYVNSGLRAGQAGSRWDRRAKVPLGGISWTLIRALRSKPGGVLEARIAGAAGDGGPACATVQFLDSGWVVTRSPA
jgi:Family of unknown function (DUF5990)